MPLCSYAQAGMVPAAAPSANTPATVPSVASAPAPMPSLAQAPVSPPVPTATPPVPMLPPAVTPPGAGIVQTLPATPTAADHAPLRLTADAAVVQAIGKNLGLTAALKDVFAAQAGVKSAAALSPPIFTIAPAFQTGGTTDGLLFEQPLELNGTRDARGEVARAELRLSQAQAIVQLQALVYTIRLDFYMLARAKQQAQLAHDLRVAAEQFDVLAQKQVALGARPGIEQRQTAIEAARARTQETLAVGVEQSALAALNAYLGRTADAPIEILSGLTEVRALVVPDTNAAQKQALAGRAEIAAAEATRDIPRAQARLSRASGRPDAAPEFRISQITPKYMDAGLGIVFTVPLDYGTRRNEIRRQELTAEAADARLTGTQAQVRLEVVQAVARLAAAEAALVEYDGSLLENARVVLDASQFGFQEGQTTIIAVLDAQRTYRAIANERLDALAQVELDRAVGTVPHVLLSQFQKESQPR